MKGIAVIVRLALLISLVESIYLLAIAISYGVKL